MKKKLSEEEREYVKETAEFWTDERTAMELTRMRHEMGIEGSVGVRQVRWARQTMGIKKPPGRRRDK